MLEFTVDSIIIITAEGFRVTVPLEMFLKYMPIDIPQYSSFESEEEKIEFFAELIRNESYDI